MKKAILILLFALIGYTGSAQIVSLNNYCGDTTFDLTSLNGQWLGNQNPSDFYISFHGSQSDANANTNPIVNPTNYQATASQQLIFIRIENLNVGGVTIYPLTLVVNTTLNVQMTMTLNDPSSNIIANPTVGQEPYTYQWSYNGTPLVGETSNSVFVLNLPSGTFSVTVTDANGCQGSGTMNSSVPQTIVANDDNLTFSNLDGGITPPGVGTILSNDQLNGLPVSLNNVSLSLVSTTDFHVGLNSQGQVYVDWQTASGTYTLVYQICELTNPSNCDTATVVVTVDYCRTATPVIDSIIQPTCEVSTGTINISGLPQTGTWTLSLFSSTQQMTYTGTGPTFSLQNLVPDSYYFNVLAEDILLANCYASFNLQFFINAPAPIGVYASSNYVDFNNDGFTNVGDVIQYTFNVNNYSCSDVTDVMVVSSDYTVLGGPIPVMVPGATDSTTFSATYVITQEDINNGMVTTSYSLTQNGVPIGDNAALDTFYFNLSDGIELNAFLDYNANGVQDNLEPHFNFGEFHYAINGGPVSNISASDGMFFIYESDPINIYDISYIVNSALASYYIVAPASYSNITVASGSGITTYNFPITVAPFTDLSVQLYSYWAPPRPGFLYQNQIAYSNHGNLPITSGTVTFVKDPLLSITDISEPGAVANANGFTFDFVNLLPNQTRYITINMQVPTIPTVALGDQLTNSCSVSVPENDTNTNNNNASLTQTVVGSYDPNDKSEKHGGEVLFSSFTANDYLTYTIRFENTGTANAVNVKVNDLLDSHLDETSVRTLTASHPFVLKRVENAMSWNFDGIDLPPSVENDAVTGHGYIVFEVKPKTGFALGDVIPNTADIFFDFNPAIVTNTCTTEFVPFLGVNAFDNSTFEYYPNPTSDVVTFAMKNASTIESIAVMDVLGKALISKTVNYSNAVIDLSGLEKGIYLVKLHANGQTKTVKITKQ